MSFNRRIAIAGFIVTVAVVFATLVNGSFPIYVDIALSILSLLLVLVAFIIVFYIKIKSGNILEHLRTLLPICKRNIIKNWTICARCLGKILGIILSVIFFLVINYHENVFNRLVSINSWWLFLMLFILTIPTVINGIRRRITCEDKSDMKWYNSSILLMFFGLLSGLSWITAFLLIKSLLN